MGEPSGVLSQGMRVDIVGLNLTGSALVLTGGSNTYYGATTIQGPATLQSGATNSFSANSGVTVTGTLDLHGFANAISSFSGIRNCQYRRNFGNFDSGKRRYFQRWNYKRRGIGSPRRYAAVIDGEFSQERGLGPTTIASGATLQAGALNAFSPSTAVTVTGPLGILDLNSYSNTIEAFWEGVA